MLAIPAKQVPLPHTLWRELSVGYGELVWQKILHFFIHFDFMLLHFRITLLLVVRLLDIIIEFLFIIVRREFLHKET
jgi:hypothetical protein